MINSEKGSITLGGRAPLLALELLDILQGLKKSEPKFFNELLKDENFLKLIQARKINTKKGIQTIYDYSLKYTIQKDGYKSIAEVPPHILSILQDVTKRAMGGE